MTYSDETNEIYFIEPGHYPAQFIGKTFQELRNLLEDSQSNSAENPLILLGIKQADETVQSESP